METSIWIRKFFGQVLIYWSLNQNVRKPVRIENMYHILSHIVCNGRVIWVITVSRLIIVRPYTIQLTDWLKESVDNLTAKLLL